MNEGLKENFMKWAKELTSKIDNRLVTMEDVAGTLFLIYMIGVIDSNIYSDDERSAAYNKIKEIYPHLNTSH